MGHTYGSTDPRGRPYCYGLDGKPISIEESGAVFVDPDRVVARTDVGLVTVSTVFLVIDHRIGFLDPDGPPILWETMIFQGLDEDHAIEEFADYQERYTSRALAEFGHAVAVNAVRRWLLVSRPALPPGGGSGAVSRR